MLLNTAIATQQNLYVELQAQIEALQEKQREIQAYLQTLGSVESKMESAAALVQEAIAQIREHCSDELGAYRDLVTSFFGNAPVAMIESGDNPDGDDDPTDPDPNSTPEDDDTEPEKVEEVTVTVVSEVVEETATEEDGESHTENDVKPAPSGFATQSAKTASGSLPTVPAIANMKKPDLIAVMAAHGLSTDGTVKELKMRLGAHVMSLRTIKLKPAA